jgi:hypothetical protein
MTTTVVAERWSKLRTLNALKQAVEDAILAAKLEGADPETVYLETTYHPFVTAALLETRLEDGSKVFNLRLS